MPEFSVANASITCKVFSCKMSVWSCCGRFARAVYTGHTDLVECARCPEGRDRMQAAIDCVNGSILGKKTKYDFSNVSDEDLLNASDKEIGERLSIPAHAIRGERGRRGLNKRTGFGVKSKYDFNGVSDEDLLNEADKKISKNLSIPISAIKSERKKRGINKIVKKYGLPL